MKFRVALGLVGLVGLLATASTGAASAADGATVTPFTAAYPGGVGVCSGNRIEKAGRNAFIKDVETCITTIDFYAPGTYSVTDPTVEWCSDFDGFDSCNLATSGTLTVSRNRDGTYTWDIVAYYAER
jgi:hypothetical protein